MRTLRALLVISAAVLALVASPGAVAKTPAGWPFVDYNEALQITKRTGKPMFVYFEIGRAHV